MNKQLLENKVAIVTGGSSGVGLSIGELFTEEGACVVLTGRTQSKLDEAVAQITAKGGKAIGVAGDVSNPDDVKRTFEEAVKAFGKVDIVINNAGHGSMSKSIEGTDNDLYDKIMDANVKGPFLFCREAIDYFLPRGEGNIINVASVNAIRPITGAVYGASKAALLALTKNTAMRTVGTKIRVNCLCPGLTLTPMAFASTVRESDTKVVEALNETESVAAPSKAVFDEVQPKDLFPTNGSMGDYLHARTNRFCACEAIDEARAALFLASELSSGVHGQALVVDRGGYL